MLSRPVGTGARVKEWILGSQKTAGWRRGKGRGIEAHRENRDSVVPELVPVRDEGAQGGGAGDQLREARRALRGRDAAAAPVASEGGRTPRLRAPGVRARRPRGGGGQHTRRRGASGAPGG